MKIPKKYKDQIELIEAESGLIDDCKYMVYLKEGWTQWGFGNSFPIKNGRELAEFMQDVVKSEEVEHTI